jgi:hypothetical protein
MPLGSSTSSAGLSASSSGAGWVAASFRVSQQGVAAAGRPPGYSVELVCCLQGCDR